MANIEMKQDKNIQTNTSNNGWGGPREKAGRKPTGRRLVRIYCTEEEEKKLRAYLEDIRHEISLKEEDIMLSHLEIYGLNMKAVPAHIIPHLYRSEFIKSIDFVQRLNCKSSDLFFDKYHVTVKEMVYTNAVRPEKQIIIYAGAQIKVIQDFNPGFLL